MHRLRERLHDRILYPTQERRLRIEVVQRKRLQLQALPSKVLFNKVEYAPNFHVIKIVARGVVRYVAEVVQHLLRGLARRLVHECLGIRV